MQSLSVFDMFKIGVGPSSSHTMGPWKAAVRFLDEISVSDRPNVLRVSVDLFGSLAKTGKGHGTDIAVQMGLGGHDPRTIDVTAIDGVLSQIASTQRITLWGDHQIDFDPGTDIVFHRDAQLPDHPNGLRFTATLAGEGTIQQEFYSIGGGFVVRQGETFESEFASMPWPIETAADLLGHCDREGLRISQVVMHNERSLRSDTELRSELTAIKDAMLESIQRGCQTDGVLPGGLNVRRRASQTATHLLGERCASDLEAFTIAIKQQSIDFRRVLDWVSCFALAVNEENAAMGRVVTAPTNGAAGVIPAVLMYYLCFCEGKDDSWIYFLLTASEIGSIFKKGATISAAMGGCQAEIGVSSAMAAAALTESLGGTPRQATEAAEIAMEHHLGMTCDPVGGLVQIPCIERNAMGAIKAITAAQMSLQRDPSQARVSLDAVVRTMWETAQVMNAKYKETSEGGLAVQITVNVSEC
ncbi:L-serine dehydratase 2 [Rubripirellula tenax]|uniref:L-serine dehydratase n=1 Tax=Rubripirellula tenax TaxID=2528015 RepID=A0A5C6FLB8_9BACT|nr:L-serine ammonia-lyase [Rubripirellula tenax]TWU60342.1 L-serine dehydratase 2 [Rubripirellula tenax]